MTESAAGRKRHEGRERSLSALLGRPVDPASLAAFRVLFGLMMAAGLSRFLLQGWPEKLYVQPSFFFKYPGFAWVEVPDRPGLYLLFAGLIVSALCIALGLLYRIATLTFFFGFAYLQLLDVTNYLNHYYFVLLLAGWLVVLPLHRAYALDALWDRRGPAESLPAWWVYALRCQIAVLYFYAGLAKLSTDWLLHAQPLQIWLLARTETPVLGYFFAWPVTAYLMSWAGFLYDLTIPLWLSLRRTRPYAYLVVLCFHLVTHLLFDIGMFPLIMSLVTLIYFDPSWPRRVLRLPQAAVATHPLRSPPRWAWAAFAVYAALQVLVPLRHFVIPGDVLWNEAGMRYAWKVMVREKNGSVSYRVRSKATGREWRVNATDYLTWRQANEMSGQPDLILQLAHHVRDDFQQRGLGPVEVYADVFVSWNGRPSARLIDPTRDLAEEPDAIFTAAYVLPEPNAPPLDPHRR